MDLLLQENETKEIIISDYSSLNFKLEENSKLIVKFLMLDKNQDINIKGELKKNAWLEALVLDFSNGNFKFTGDVLLLGDNSMANLDLASLSSNNDKKEFNISFIHKSNESKSFMNNYGVSLDSSYLEFSGINHIEKNSFNCRTNQVAKIIIFDKDAKGRASPILKIDNNEVNANHAATVGRINDEHLFYLKSKGLTEEEAKALIIRGYLKPIASNFSSDVIDKVDNIIKEKVRV